MRALTETAARRARVDDRGIAYPDPLTTNMAKYTFATGYHEAVELVQDCAGGLLVTGPGGEDWDSREVRPVLEKYFGGAAPAEDRLRVMNLISDLTARDFGGYQAVLAVHAEGSIEAEKMQIFRSYAADEPLAYARRLAGLDLTAGAFRLRACTVHAGSQRVTARSPARHPLEPAAPVLDPAAVGQAVERRRQARPAEAGAQDQLVEGGRLPAEGVEDRTVTGGRRRPALDRTGRTGRRPSRPSGDEDVGGVAAHGRTRRRAAGWCPPTPAR